MAIIPRRLDTNWTNIPSGARSIAHNPQTVKLAAGSGTLSHRTPMTLNRGTQIWEPWGGGATDPVDGWLEEPGGIALEAGGEVFATVTDKGRIHFEAWNLTDISGVFATLQANLATSLRSVTGTGATLRAPAVERGLITEGFTT
jgi:hypothetical protein